MIKGIEKYLKLKYSDCISDLTIEDKGEGKIKVIVKANIDALKFKPASPQYDFFYRRRINELKNRVEMKKKLKKLFKLNKVDYSYSFEHINLVWITDKIMEIYKDLSKNYPDIDDKWDLLHPVNETFEELIFYYPIILHPDVKPIKFFVEEYDLQVTMEFPYGR